MAIWKEQIAKKIKGSLMENEDWWYLCYDTDTHEFHIEHEWSHVDAYNVAKAADSGSSTHAVDAWNGPGSENVAAAKEKLLARANG
jgi:hypothetical protein